MLLGFKKQFAPYVADGSKQHTIRGPRSGNRQIRVGDRLDLYASPRTDQMKLLGRHPCTRVESLTIHRPSERLVLEILIDGEPLMTDEVYELAWRDGFRDHGRGEPAMWAMAKFWQDIRGLTPADPGRVSRGRIIIDLPRRRLGPTLEPLSRRRGGRIGSGAEREESAYWDGQLIHWDPSIDLAAPAKGKASRRSKRAAV